MRVLIVLWALIAGALGGCVSVPMASLEADSSAKQFQPPRGMANIYLYRNETLGSAISMTVSLDGKVMGKTGPLTYFLWQVAPGRHEIASHTENTAKITIDAREGRNHYVWQEVKMGFFQPGSLLREVDVEQGRKGVMESKRAVTEN